MAEAWRAATGTELYEALGMSEISTYISTGPGMAVKPGSPGKPQPGRKVAILAAEEDTPRELPPGEVGLLAVHRSDSGLMLGYWRRPEEEALVYRGEWFCGGDLAHIDEDGYVWFHGRHDDILNPMGYRLSPLEIEGVLSQHPLVQEVAVAELAVTPDVKILAAFVVPHGRGDRESAARLGEGPPGRVQASAQGGVRRPPAADEERQAAAARAAAPARRDRRRGPMIEQVSPATPTRSCREASR